MTQVPPAVFKIPTKSPQPARRRAARPAARAKADRRAPSRVLANGSGRAATRGGGEVIELEYGITVYPAREERGRWERGLARERPTAAMRGGDRGEAGRQLEKVTAVRRPVPAELPNVPRRWHCPGAPSGRRALPISTSSAPQNSHKSASAAWFPTESPRTKRHTGRLADSSDPYSRIRVTLCSVSVAPN
jgi:hypothetical protein